MRRLGFVALVLGLSATMLPSLPGSARAATVIPISGVSPSGIVREPDGTLWVADEFDGELDQLSATGSVIKDVEVSEAQITDLANGSDGEVYVAGSSGLFHFDPATVTNGEQLTPTYVQPAASTGCAGNVGTVVSAGTGYMAYTGTGHLANPSDPGSYVDCHVLGLYKISDATKAEVALTGDAYDLAYGGGKVWSTTDAGELERFGVSGATLGHEATFDLPDVGAGVAIMGANVYTALYSSNAVAEVSTTAADGASPTVLHPPTNITIHAPHSVLAGADGFLYVTDSDENSPSPQGALIRLNPDGTSWHREALPSGGRAWRIVQGASADRLWVTVRDSSLLLVVSGPPVATTGAAAAAATHETLHGKVAPHGEATTFRFEYGKTSGYGSLTKVQATSGVTTKNVHAHVVGLKPSTTYHYRLIAANDRGTSEGTDRTFTTPPQVHAKLALKTASRGTRTLIKRLVITKIPRHGEVLLTCKTPHHKAGCPVTARRIKAKGGRVSLTRTFRGHALPARTTVGLEVAAPGRSPELIRYTMRAHLRPRRSVG
jgi:streptogramin lyase